MPESAQHQQLVNLLEEEVKKIVPMDWWNLICYDTADTLSLPPKTIEGYRPDIYFRFQDLLIIGEAKSSNDVVRQHSRAQYEAYLKECARFNGTSFLLLAVPWMDKPSAYNILQKLKKKHPGDYILRVYEGIGGAI